MSIQLLQCSDDFSETSVRKFSRRMMGCIQTYFFKIVSTTPGALWTILSMTITIWIYSAKLGWTLASGLMVLLLIHECGHLVASFLLGMRVSAPIFIPYMGAIIDLKEVGHNRWKLALMGIAGPLAGTIATVGCFTIYHANGSSIMAALAAGGCIQNLFNLIPMGSLDGGHVVGAIARWLWVPGYLLMSWLAWQIHTPVICISLVVMLPQVLSVFQSKNRGGENFRRPGIWRRSMLGGAYLGLILILSEMLIHTAHYVSI
jgi:Zn-dependent protease